MQQSNSSWIAIAKDLEEILGNTEFQKKLKADKKRRSTMLKYSAAGLFVLVIFILWFMGARWVFNKLTFNSNKPTRESTAIVGNPSSSFQIGLSDGINCNQLRS